MTFVSSRCVQALPLSANVTSRRHRAVYPVRPQYACSSPHLGHHEICGHLQFSATRPSVEQSYFSWRTTDPAPLEAWGLVLSYASVAAAATHYGHGVPITVSVLTSCSCSHARVAPPSTRATWLARRQSATRQLQTKVTLRPGRNLHGHANRQNCPHRDLFHGTSRFVKTVKSFRGKSQCLLAAPVALA
jgi:hypothetical protein